MDPATLYIVFLLPNGTLKPMERPFVDAGACEKYVAHQIRPKTEKATIVRYECVELLKMQSAPKWYLRYAPQRLIDLAN